MYSANITRTNILYVSDVCLQAYTIEYIVFECRLIMYKSYNIIVSIQRENMHAL